MSKRITELNECKNLQDTDTFIIDCETNGTRKVSARKAREYFAGNGYVLTDEDKAEIVNEVLNELPKAENYTF